MNPFLAFNPSAKLSHWINGHILAGEEVSLIRRATGVAYRVVEVKPDRTAVIVDDDGMRATVKFGEESDYDLPEKTVDRLQKITDSQCLNRDLVLLRKWVSFISTQPVDFTVGQYVKLRDRDLHTTGGPGQLDLVYVHRILPRDAETGIQSFIGYWNECGTIETIKAECWRYISVDIDSIAL